MKRSWETITNGTETKPTTIQTHRLTLSYWGNLDGNGQQIEDLSTLSLYQTYLQLEYNSAVDKRPLEDLFK